MAGIVYAVVIVFFLRDAPPAAGAAAMAAAAPPVRLGEALHSLFRRGAFILALCYWGLLGLAGWAVVGWMPTYLNEHFHLSQGVAGLSATGYLQAAALVGVLVGGVWADRWSRTNPRAPIFVPVIGLGLAAPGILLAASTNLLPLAIACLMLYGLAKAFPDTNMMPILSLVADGRYRATGYGVLNFFSCAVGGVTIYAGGALRDAHVDINRIFQLAALSLVVCAPSCFSSSLALPRGPEFSPSPIAHELRSATEPGLADRGAAVGGRVPQLSRPRDDHHDAELDQGGDPDDRCPVRPAHHLVPVDVRCPQSVRGISRRPIQPEPDHHLLAPRLVRLHVADRLRHHAGRTAGLTDPDGGERGVLLPGGRGDDCRLPPQQNPLACEWHSPQRRDGRLRPRRPRRISRGRPWLEIRVSALWPRRHCLCHPAGLRAPRPPGGSGAHGYRDGSASPRENGRGPAQPFQPGRLHHRPVFLGTARARQLGFRGLDAHVSRRTF